MGDSEVTRLTKHITVTETDISFHVDNSPVLCISQPISCFLHCNFGTCAVLPSNAQCLSNRCSWGLLSPYYLKLSPPLLPVALQSKLKVVVLTFRVPSCSTAPNSCWSQLFPCTLLLLCLLVCTQCHSKLLFPAP